MILDLYADPWAVPQGMATITAKQCPMCGNTPAPECGRILQPVPWSYNIGCLCGLRGPTTSTVDEAIIGWNRIEVRK